MQDSLSQEQLCSRIISGLDLIIPENLRGRHGEGYYRVMESGGSRYSVELLAARTGAKGAHPRELEARQGT